MKAQAEKLGIKINLEMDIEKAQLLVTEALKDEGFGVLTEIDVKDTLKKKIDVDFRPYRILGACNPPLAHEALKVMPDVGLLLPCNVVLDQVDEGLVEVTFLDPRIMMNIVNDPKINKISEDASARLERAAFALKEN